MFVFPFSFPPSSLQILGVFIQLNKPELVSFFCVCFKYLIPVLDPCYGSIELIFCSCFGKLQDCRRTFVYNFSLNKNGLHVWPSPYLRTLQFISLRRFRFLTWYLLQRSKFQSSDLQGLMVIERVAACISSSMTPDIVDEWRLRLCSTTNGGFMLLTS